MKGNPGVLVVDDDAGLVEALAGALRARGYAPVAASTGQEALDAIQATMPAVALVGLELEDLSGLEVIRRIGHVSPRTACIVLAAHASRAPVLEAIDLGVYSYCRKPYDVEQLLLVIGRAIENQETARALQESEERYRNLFDLIPIGLYRTSAQGQVLDVNPALAEMLGYPDGEALRGVKLGEGYVNPAYHQKWADEMERVGIIRDYATQWYRADGSLLWVRESTVAVLDEAGEVLYYEGAVQDISEQRQAQARIQSLLDRQIVVNRLALALGETTDLERVFHIVYEHVCALMDADAFVVSFYDDQAEHLRAGYVVSEGEVMDVAVFPPIPLEEPGHGMQSQVVRTGQPLYLPDARQTMKSMQTIYTVTDDGEVVAGPPQGDTPSNTISFLCVPMKIEGQIIGTMQVQSYRFDAYTPADAELLSSLANVAAIAVQNARLFQDLQDQIRTQRETQMQLIQAEKMSAVGQLAGGIAHDFNNLLTVIHLCTQMLEKQLHPEDPLWPQVQRIDDAVQQAAALTRQLLSFSRKEVIEPQMLDLNQVIHDLSKMLRRIIGEDIKLVLNLAEGLWPVHADPSQVGQVLMNVVVNAHDAMPHGGTLTIETANQVLDATHAAHHLDAQPGEHVLLALTDTGIGMSDAVKAHLFEPFFTTKERGKGTGLGLSTVYGIVTQSGGHVTVRSEPGLGTTFRVYLPRADADEAAGEAALQATHPRARSDSETILVVEDSAGVRDLTVSILRGEGYHVLTAANGPDALQLARGCQTPIHLLLTDVVMPQMSGPELAEKIEPLHPAIKILYASGYTDDKIAHHGVLHPGVALLRKPFTLESLVHKVRTALDATTSEDFGGLG
jgi:PAS domain S-box-containing protein